MTASRKAVALAIATAIGAYLYGDATIMDTAQLVFTALIGVPVLLVLLSRKA